MLRDEVRAHVALEKGNVEQFLESMEVMMASDSHFKQIQNKLQDQIMEDVDPITVLRIFALSLDSLVRRPKSEKDKGRLTTPLLHLLLELIPAAVKRCPQGLEDVRPEVSQLFRRCCQVEHARVAAKVAVHFRVTEAQLENLTAVETYVRELLLDSATFNPAITLLLQFPEIRERFDASLITESIVSAGQEGLAARFVEGLGTHDAKRHFVSCCVTAGRLRDAANYVRRWDMQADFPDVERQYRLRTIEKLSDRQLWEAAVSFAGESDELQRLVLQRMASEGELALADTHRQQWDLPAEALEVDPEVLREQEERERQTYLQLDIPPGALQFISEPSQVPLVITTLLAAKSIGLDTEWRSTNLKGETESPVALLQIGTGTEVFLIDMIALGRCSELDEGLARVMKSPNIAVVGFEIQGDLKKVASSYMSCTAFREVRRVVELQDMWRIRQNRNHPRHMQITSKKRSLGGLSALSELLLGKPLNKSMQVSNWERRPLSSRQTNYAALDAHVCVRLFDILAAEDPSSVQPFDYFYPSRPTQRKGIKEAKKAPRDEDDDHSQGGAGRTGTEAVPSGSNRGSAEGETAKNSVPEDSQAEHSADGEGSGQTAQSLASITAGDISSVKARLVKVMASAAGEPEAEGTAKEQCPLVWKALVGLGALQAFRRIVSPSADGALSNGLEAAEAIPAPSECIAKTLAVVVRGAPWLVVLRATERLDFRKVARHIGCARRAVRIASSSELDELYGYKTGTLPPFGYSTDLPCLVDKDLGAAKEAKEDYPVYCGSGLAECCLALSLEALRLLSGGSPADVVQGSSQPEEPSAICPAAAMRSSQSPPSKGEANRLVLFTCDTMPARLCRWLRCLGCDVSILPDDVERQQVPKVAAKAVNSGRVFLTRCQKLAGRDLPGVFWLPSDDATEQLADIVSFFKMRFDKSSLMSRCSKCGGGDLSRVTHEAVAASGEVPPRLLNRIRQFWQCQGCSKMFWIGPKSKSAMQMLQNLMPESLLADEEGDQPRQQGGSDSDRDGSCALEGAEMT